MKKRYPLLDIIRAVALINMILYHTLWDMKYIFSFNLGWFSEDKFYYWQQSICITFIFLSGFCISLGKNALKNGIKVFLCGGGVSAVTLIFSYESRVIFGILTFLGTCMILHFFLYKVWERLNASFGFITTLALFVVTKTVPFGRIFGVKLPQTIYKNFFTAFLGFPQKEFYSSDYFSIIPWAFLFLAGYFLFRLFKEEGLLSRIPEVRNPLFEWIGKNSLLIYMLHQPIIYFVLTIIKRMC